MDNEKFINDTCDLFISHLRNSNNYNKIRGDGKTLGVHSRLLEHLFNPEDSFYLKGVSECYIKNITEKKHKEHIVPLSYLTWEIITLIDNEYCNYDIIKIMRRCLGIVYITKSEARKLDYELKLKNRMPDGWSLMEDSPYARLDVAGIKIRNEWERS